MNVIEVEHLGRVYGSGHTAVTAVDDITLAIAAGDILLVMGPSGSGKTTLISLMGTLLTPTTGRVRIDGEDTAALSDKQLAGLRLRKLGFMFQSFNLLSSLTAQANVALPLLLNGVDRKTARQRARVLLANLHLENRMNSLPKNLSGGEKQRVAVARALANEPMLILADEPTANLDSKTGIEVMRLLCQTACLEKRAVIIVSHDPRLTDVVKRVITIEDGRLTREEVGGHDATCPHHHPIVNHAVTRT